MCFYCNVLDDLKTIYDCPHVLPPLSYLLRNQPLAREEEGLSANTGQFGKTTIRNKQKPDIVVQREIRTRRHDAIIYQTCRPNLEKYKKGTIYRGILEWNNLDVDTRNTDTFLAFRLLQ